ncbi:MAG: hypothetical protein MZW92_77490 [Comamonadaceae bacterium]|nr:hypothetical protein [Comamonadaceae bacterium]
MTQVGEDVRILARLELRARTDVHRTRAGRGDASSDVEPLAGRRRRAR